MMDNKFKTKEEIPNESIHVDEDTQLTIYKNYNGLKLVDISNLKSTYYKYKFTKNNLIYFLDDESIDGVIFKKGVSTSKYKKFMEKYDEFELDYEFNGGLTCKSSFLSQVLEANFMFPGDYEIMVSIFTITIEGGIQYDIGSCICPRGSVYPTVLLEVAVSNSIGVLFIKMFNYFKRIYTRKVIGIKLSQRDDNKNFTGVAIVMDRVNDNPIVTSIISFGSEKTSVEYEAELLSHSKQNVIQPIGVTSTNPTINNVEEGVASFVINIQFDSVFFGVIQPQLLPTHANANGIFFDLFNLKKELDTLPSDMSFCDYC